MGDEPNNQHGNLPQGNDNEPEYLDRDKLDFDPDDGLYTGTAVEGTSEIPGPHENDDDSANESADQGQQQGQDEEEQQAVDQ